MAESQWADLSGDLLKGVLEQLPTTQWADVREVCKPWRDVVDSCVGHITPAYISARWFRRLSTLQGLDLRFIQEARHSSGLQDFVTSCQLAESPTLRDLKLSLGLYQRLIWALTGQPSHILEPIEGQVLSLSVRKLTLTHSGTPSEYTAQLFKNTPLVQELTLQSMRCSTKTWTPIWPIGSHLTCLKLEECERFSVGLQPLQAAGLKSLVLRWCQGLLVKSTLHDLGKMTTLEHLAFWPADDTSREAQACGPEAFEHLGQLTALTHLSLNGLVQLNDEGLKMLTSLSGLQCLDISNTAVSSRGLDCILHLHKLRDLQVAGCLMTAPSALLRILSKQAQLTQLNVLECRGALLAASVQPLLPLLACLRRLSISNCITSDALSSFSALEHLTGLQVGIRLDPNDEARGFSMQLTGLSTMTRLKQLSIWPTAPGLRPVGHPWSLFLLTNLERLNVAQCLPMHFWGSCDGFSRLTRLTELDLNIAYDRLSPSHPPAPENFQEKVSGSLVYAAMTWMRKLPLEQLRIWTGMVSSNFGLPNKRMLDTDRLDLVSPEVFKEIVGRTHPVPGHLLRAITQGQRVDCFIMC